MHYTNLSFLPFVSCIFNVFFLLFFGASNAHKKHTIMYKKACGKIQLRGNLTGQHGCFSEPNATLLNTLLDSSEKWKKKVIHSLHRHCYETVYSSISKSWTGMVEITVIIQQDNSYCMIHFSLNEKLHLKKYCFTEKCRR